MFLSNVPTTQYTSRQISKVKCCQAYFFFYFIMKLHIFSGLFFSWFPEGKFEVFFLFLWTDPLLCEHNFIITKCTVDRQKKTKVDCVYLPASTTTFLDRNLMSSFLTVDKQMLTHVLCFFFVVFFFYYRWYIIYSPKYFFRSQLIWTLLSSNLNRMKLKTEV